MIKNVYISLLFNEESKNSGLQFLALNEDLVLYCDNWLRVIWTFEPFEYNYIQYFVKRTHYEHYLTVKKMDYFKSGTYYCHGLTNEWDEDYLVQQYSIIVHGKKYTSSVCST